MGSQRDTAEPLHFTSLEATVLLRHEKISDLPCLFPYCLRLTHTKDTHSILSGLVPQ